MKRMLVVFMTLVLILAFTSCNPSLIDIMGRMGKNLAGTEQVIVDKAVEAAKPESGSVSEPVENEDGSVSKTFTQGSGETSKPLFTVTEKTESNEETSEEEKKTSISIGEGETKFSLTLDKEAAEKLSTVEAVIAPKSLDEVLSGLKSDTNKEQIQNELKKPADKESKKAAEGTQTVIGAIVDTIGLPEKVEIKGDMTEEAKKQAEAQNAALDTVNKILGRTEEGEEKKEMTQADVVVLTAITNVVFNENLLTNLSVMNEKETEDMTPQQKEDLKQKQEEASKVLQKTIADEAVTLVDVVSTVPSDMAGDILNILNMFTSSTK